nr:unnamed protein product [Callosobruchus analis]
MMVWHEGMAHRGSSEIASAILLYVTEKFNPLTPGDERKLVVWSDRCVGQNNNWRLITLLRLLLLEKYFTRIEQKFLTRGHSFLLCDRDFALRECNKKLSSVYIPFQWTEVIAKSRVHNPFKVVYMQSSLFLNALLTQKM